MQRDLSKKTLASGGCAEPVLIKLWPDAGQRLGLSKWSTYEAARSGQIPTLRFGRLIKVPVAALNRMLETGEQPGAGR